MRQFLTTLCVSWWPVPDYLSGEEAGCKGAGMMWLNIVCEAGRMY